MAAANGRKAEVVMMQSEVRVKVGKYKMTFDKGSYPEPRTDVVAGIEVFKVKFFTNHIDKMNQII